MGRIKLALGIILLLGGLAVTGQAYLANQEPAGPPTEEVDGVILNSTTSEVPQEDGPSKYRAIVRYEFTYEGQTYESTRVYPDRDTLYNSSTDAFRTASRYDEGDEVTVTIPNGDPSQSYLVVLEEVPYEEAQMIVGVVLALIGVSLVRNNR